MIIQIFTALISAILGGFIAHLLTARRDRLNKRREKKIDYLIEAYRRLADSAHRNYSKDTREAMTEFHKLFNQVESALSDIQLFGSSAQVKLAQDFARQFARNNTGTYDELLQNLRMELRKELNLGPVPPEIVHLRVRL